jgi:hypothetical protein
MLKVPDLNRDDKEGIRTRLVRTQVILTDLDVLYKEYSFKNLKDIIDKLIISISVEENNLKSVTVTQKEMQSCGPPKFYLPFEVMEYYVQNGFKATQIATMLNLSLSTINRRLREFNLRKKEIFTKFSDDELDCCINQVLVDFPNTGYKKMRGYLLSRGIIVQERRTRESMRRVDPEGVILRCLQSRPVLRRKYCVAGPLSLWHMDGNHKLIRLKLKFIMYSFC